MSDLYNKWNAYWFAPAPYLNLSVIRILVVSGQLLLLNFYFIYDYERIDMFASLDELMFLPIPALRLMSLPFGWGYRPSFETLMLIYYATIIVGLFALIGFLSNLSVGLFTIGNIFIIGHFYSYGDFHHTEAPLIILLVVLTLSPCGKVLSADRLISTQRNSTVRVSGAILEGSAMAGWGIKLMQWVFALIYLSACLEKLHFIGGLDWLNGYTLQYYIARDTLARGSLLGELTHRQHEVALAAQYVSVIFQGTFWICLFIPVLKWVYFPLGFVFHVVIYLQLNAFFPEWMLAYAVFVPWALIHLRLSGGKQSHNLVQTKPC